MKRPLVHQEVVKYLEEKVHPLELSPDESPESLYKKALIRQGKLELIAVLKSMSKDS